MLGAILFFVWFHSISWERISSTASVSDDLFVQDKDTPVSDIMTKELLTVNPGDSVAACMRIMTEKRVRHLPVLEGTKLVGILSIGDVVNWLISAQKAMIDNLERYTLAEIKDKE